MRTLNFYYDVLLETEAPVYGHAFALRCLPPAFPGQDILDVTLNLDPSVSYAVQHDAFGNLIETGRVEQPHDRFRYTVSGTARLDLSRRAAEPAHPIFRFPSHLTAPSDEMRAYAAGLNLSEDPRQRAFELVSAVGERMTYTPGSTGVGTTAAEAFANRRGVCQDFSHVYLALAHLSGVTARYVNGLPVGEGFSHAWCEVWLDGVWTGIDPTRGSWADEDYIRLNVGRDFEDCPIELGIFTGAARQHQTVLARVTRQ